MKVSNVTSIETIPEKWELDMDDDTAIGVMLAITSHAKVILYTNSDSTILNTLYFKEGKKFVYDAVLNEFTYDEPDLDEWWLRIRHTHTPWTLLKLKCNICGNIIFGIAKLRKHKYKKHTS